MDLSEIISRLEAAKILQLYSFLLDSDASPYSSTHEPAKALGLPNSEFLIKYVREPGDRYRELVNWVFQIEYLPAALWDAGGTSSFIDDCLQRAAVDLNHNFEQFALFDTANTASAGNFYFKVGDRFDYYLLTNLCLLLEPGLLSRFSSSANAIFGKFIHHSELALPEFGLGTPETFLKSSPDLVEEFVVDLLQTPSSFTLVALEGEIVFSPMTEQGSNYASRWRDATDPNIHAVSTTILSSLPDCTVFEQSAISDLRALIDGKNTRENDFQQFFIENPQFLSTLNDDYCEVLPQICLYNPKIGRLFPDIMVRVQESNIWDVVELKLPNSPLTVISSGVERASKEAAKGICQLLKYRNFFTSKENRDRVYKTYNISPYEPCLSLVIGRGHSTQLHEWRSIRKGFPNVKLVSYDYIFHQALKRHNSILAKGSAKALEKP